MLPPLRQSWHRSLADAASGSNLSRCMSWHLGCVCHVSQISRPCKHLRMNIGSRPAKRRNYGGIDTLRWFGKFEVFCAPSGGRYCRLDSTLAFFSSRAAAASRFTVNPNSRP